MRWSFKYWQLCLILNSVLLLNWRTYLTRLLNIFILYHKYLCELLLTKTLCDGCHNDRASAFDPWHISICYVDTSVLLENIPLVKFIKLHPGPEWFIFHNLTREFIDDVISVISLYYFIDVVRKILFCHSKIKFISSRHRVISSI